MALLCWLLCLSLIKLFPSLRQPWHYMRLVKHLENIQSEIKNQIYKTTKPYCEKAVDLCVTDQKILISGSRSVLHVKTLRASNHAAHEDHASMTHVATDCECFVCALLWTGRVLPVLYISQNESSTAALVEECECCFTFHNNEIGWGFGDSMHSIWWIGHIRVYSERISCLLEGMIEEY